MKCSLTALCVVLLIVVPNSFAQTGSTGGLSDNLAENTPADNVSGGAVRARAPGRIIDAARSRHVSLAQARLAAQRSGDASGLMPEDAASAASAGSTDSLGGLLGGSGSSLLNTLLGSGLGGALTGGSGANIANLLGGSSTGTSGNAGSTGGSAGGSSGLPPEVIQMLTDAGINLGDLNLKSKDSGTTQVKGAATQQSNDGSTSERPFRVRWADAMLSTFFTAATVGFQTQDFIDIIKNAFRPFLVPNATATAGDTQSGASQTTASGGI